jgi:two-component system OmpR family response regulator
MPKDLKRILYVEDEPVIQTIAVTVLETIGGFAVVACSSGKQAIEAAAGAGADLILLDVMMPGMDGPATLKALREIPQTATTPAIFMTGKVQASEIEHLKSLDVSPKPFDPMTLPEQISGIWRRWASRQDDSSAQSLPAASPSLDSELQALYRRYTAQLQASIAEIETLWARCVSGADPAALTALHRALHTLAGSGGTFGYTRLGNLAKAMQLALAPCLESAALPPALLESLLRQIEELKKAATSPDAPA